MDDALSPRGTPVRLHPSNSLPSCVLQLLPLPPRLPLVLFALLFKTRVMGDATSANATLSCWWRKWECLLTGPQGNLGKALHRAVRANDRGGVMEALDAGADPNWVNPVPTFLAVFLRLFLFSRLFCLFFLFRVVVRTDDIGVAAACGL